MILQYKSRGQVGYQQDMMERLCQEQRRTERQTKCGRRKEKRNGERMDGRRHRISPTESASASARYSMRCRVIDVWWWLRRLETWDCFFSCRTGAHGRFKGNLSKVRAVDDCRSCCFIRQSIYFFFFFFIFLLAGHQRPFLPHVMESRFQDSTESIREEIFPSIEPYLHSLVGKKEKKREKKNTTFTTSTV